MKRLTALLCMAVVVCVSGCTGLQAFPADNQRWADAIVAGIMDQNVLETMASELEGHVNDPGLETEIGVFTRVTTRLVGTDGEVELHATGQGNEQGPSGDYRDALIKFLLEREQVADEEPGDDAGAG